jgi:hypothetical protein
MNPFSILAILGDLYKTLSSLLCDILYFPLTSSCLGTNIFLSTLFSNVFFPQSIKPMG